MFCSKSCENENDHHEAQQLKQIQDSKDSVLAIFSGLKPSEVEIGAYGENAKLKLADLLDYLSVAGNNEQPEAFREQSKRMILQLFDNDTLRVLINDRDAKSQKTTIAGFLEHQNKLLKRLGSMQADSVWVIRQLSFEIDSVNGGQIHFGKIRLP